MSGCVQMFKKAGVDEKDGSIQFFEKLLRLPEAQAALKEALQGDLPKIQPKPQTQTSQPAMEGLMECLIAFNGLREGNKTIKTKLEQRSKELKVTRINCDDFQQQLVMAKTQLALNAEDKETLQQDNRKLRRLSMGIGGALPGTPVTPAPVPVVDPKLVRSNERMRRTLQAVTQQLIGFKNGQDALREALELVKEELMGRVESEKVARKKEASQAEAKIDALEVRSRYSEAETDRFKMTSTQMLRKLRKSFEANRQLSQNLGTVMEKCKKSASHEHELAQAMKTLSDQQEKNTESQRDLRAKFEESQRALEQKHKEQLESRPKLDLTRLSATLTNMKEVWRELSAEQRTTRDDLAEALREASDERKHMIQEHKEEIIKIDKEHVEKIEAMKLFIRNMEIERDKAKLELDKEKETVRRLSAGEMNFRKSFSEKDRQILVHRMAFAKLVNHYKHTTQQIQVMKGELAYLKREHLQVKKAGLKSSERCKAALAQLADKSQRSTCQLTRVIISQRDLLGKLTKDRNNLNVQLRSVKSQLDHKELALSEAEGIEKVEAEELTKLKGQIRKLTEEQPTASSTQAVQANKYLKGALTRLAYASQSHLGQMKKDIGAQREMFTALVQERDDLKAQVQMVKSQLDEKELELSEAEDVEKEEVARLKGQIRKLTEDHFQAKTLLNQANERLNVALTRLSESSRTHLKQMQRDITKQRERLASISDERDNLRRQVQALKSQLDDKELALSEAEGVEKEEADQITRLKGDIRKLTEEKKDLLAKSHESTAKIQSMTAGFAQLSDLIVKSQQSIAMSRKEGAMKAAALHESVVANFADMRATNEKLEAKCTQLQRELTKKTGEISGMGLSKEDANLALNQLEHEKENLLNALKELRGRYTALTMANVKLFKSTAGLLTQYKNNIVMHKEDQQAAKSRLADVCDTLRKQCDHTGDLTAVLHKLENKYFEYEGMLGDKDKKITELETSITTSKSLIANDLMPLVKDLSVDASTADKVRSQHETILESVLSTHKNEKAELHREFEEEKKQLAKELAQECENLAISSAENYDRLKGELVELRDNLVQSQRLERESRNANSVKREVLRLSLGNLTRSISSVRNTQAEMQSKLRAKMKDQKRVTTKAESMAEKFKLKLMEEASERDSLRSDLGEAEKFKVWVYGKLAMVAARFVLLAESNQCLRAKCDAILQNQGARLSQVSGLLAAVSIKFETLAKSSQRLRAKYDSTLGEQQDRLDEAQRTRAVLTTDVAILSQDFEALKCLNERIKEKHTADTDAMVEAQKADIEALKEKQRALAMNLLKQNQDLAQKLAKSRRILQVCHSEALVSRMNRSELKGKLQELSASQAALAQQTEGSMNGLRDKITRSRRDLVELQRVSEERKDEIVKLCDRLHSQQNALRLSNGSVAELVVKHKDLKVRYKKLSIRVNQVEVADQSKEVECKGHIEHLMAEQRKMQDRIARAGAVTSALTLRYKALLKDKATYRGMIEAVLPVIESLLSSTGRFHRFAQEESVHNSLERADLYTEVTVLQEEIREMRTRDSRGDVESRALICRAQEMMGQLMTQYRAQSAKQCVKQAQLSRSYEQMAQIASILRIQFSQIKSRSASSGPTMSLDPANKYVQMIIEDLAEELAQTQEELRLALELSKIKFEEEKAAGFRYVDRRLRDAELSGLQQLNTVEKARL